MKSARSTANSTPPAWSRSASFDPADDIAAPYINTGARPRVAILREQGVNGQYEMAAAFTSAGFVAVDVHMSDLIGGRVRLDAFKGLAACGGFSYGDVLGAGRGWATSILERPDLREQFAAVLRARRQLQPRRLQRLPDAGQLKGLIPGAEHWPRFLRNRSEQFEARLALVESPRVALAVLRRHGRFAPADRGVAWRGPGGVRCRPRIRWARASPCVSSKPMVDPATRYPANPNGSPGGIAGLTSVDGRAPC